MKTTTTAPPLPADLEDLLRRRDNGRITPFRRVVIETTGLADPGPVAQTFFMDDDVRAKTELDAVVALVDAKHLPLRLKDSKEAEDQIAFADVILLNKTDLVAADELDRLAPQLVPARRFGDGGRGDQGRGKQDGQQAHRQSPGCAHEN